MIIDCEMYLQSLNPARSNVELATLEALMDEAGIDQAVLMPPVSVRPDNRLFFELIKDRPRFIPCALLNPWFGAQAVAELEALASEAGLRGLKLNPAKHGFHAASDIAHPLAAKCSELGIPISVHSEGGVAHPSAIGVLAEAFPDIPFIMDHMGYRYWVPDAIAAAKRMDNLYMATTAVMEPHYIARAIEAVGVERIVFGSNGPTVRPRMQVEVVKMLGLSPEEEVLVMGGTLARLYGL